MKSRFYANYASRPTTHTIQTVTRTLATAFLLVGILVSRDVVFSTPSSEVETITGRIVAYSNNLVCLNGNAYWSMLIRVQDHAADVPSRFIEVRFSLPCKESPKWLTHKPPLQNFRLRREQDADSVLKEFLDCAPEPCPRTPMWKRVPSAEHEKLPFGQLMPNYRSVDLPLVPVV